MDIHKSTSLFTMLIALVFSGCLAWGLISVILRGANEVMLNLKLN
jgi:hypothetical protein